MKIKKPKLHPEESISFTIENENDCRIEELKHMNEIRNLHIYNLIDVRDAQDACNAKLCDKRKLIRLSLNWDKSYFFVNGDREIVDRDLDERVLDNLQPHNYLKTLEIWNYMGARSAIWMNEAQLINNLQEIDLYDCLEWEILPPFGQLPFLKTLKLWSLRKVKRLENKFHGNDMCSVFPSLHKLEFIDMKALVDWFDASVEGLFPCLTKLQLHDCPNLQELPYLPPKLESLDIFNIGWKTLNCCSISKSIPLVRLQVRRCPNITSISLGGEIRKLEKLTIEHLPSLQSFPFSLANIFSLEILKLAELPQLRNDCIVEALEHMNELHILKINNLRNVRDAEEVCSAKLCDKRKLTILSLNWNHEEGDIADPGLEERVLDNLQPHSYLKILFIQGYMGARSAIWMNETHLINNLHEIQLSKCLEWEILPPFGQLPFLKSLKLENM